MHPNAIGLGVDLAGCPMQHQQAEWPRLIRREKAHDPAGLLFQGRRTLERRVLRTVAGEPTRGR